MSDNSADVKALAAPRLVLMTNGLRPVLERFMSLPAHPVGIICWHGGSSGKLLDTLTRFELLARLYAWIRRRPYASLEHYCRKNNLRYISLEKSQTTHLKDTLAEWQIDLIVSSGCPLIPISALSDTKYGGINLHPSLLPLYRGADPLSWQVLDKAQYIGSTVHQLEAQYDTGSILAQRRVARPHGVSRDTLLNLLENEIGHDLLGEAIISLSKSNDFSGEQQPELSPTPRASRVSLHDVAQSWSLDSFTDQQFWDVVCLYGICPTLWLSLTGWRNRAIWRPHRILSKPVVATQAVTAQPTIRLSGFSKVVVDFETAEIHLKMAALSSIKNILRNRIS